MKNACLCILIIIAAFSNIYSQTKSGSGFYSGRHDSLLFDGTDEISANFLETNKDCLMKAVTVSGIVIGWAMTRLPVKNCLGEVIDSADKLVKRQIKVGDMVKAGEPITTEGRSFVILQTHDGENMILGGDNGIFGVKDYCRFPPGSNVLIWIMIKAGKLGMDWNPLLPKDVTVCTDVACVTITGTILSFEIVKEGDVMTNILKVYEGSATFAFEANMKREANEKKARDVNVQQAKLLEDYQSGKINVEEFTAKSKEIQLELIKFQQTNEITVNAGFEFRITGTDLPIDPVSMDANEKPWWEDPIFNK